MRFFRGKRADDDRGVAMVEMAIVAPLLALIVAGIVEYGTLWRDDLSMATSTRAAARVASNLGEDHLADYEAILTLTAGLSSIDGLDVEGVLIFDGAAADGAPHASCFDGAGDPQSSTGRCTYYTAADLAAVQAIGICDPDCAEFPDNSNCAGAMSLAYCPQTYRESNQSSGLSSVGVWVRADRDYLTGIFPGDGVTLTDQTVMKVEPR